MAATRAPAARTIWIPLNPRPPAPATTTVSPERTCARVMSARHGDVTASIQTAAASKDT